MKLTLENTVFTATPAANSFAAARKEKLEQDPLTIRMEDYGHMEKVGSFNFRLPTNDEQITTRAGELVPDLVIYCTEKSAGPRRHNRYPVAEIKFCTK